MNCLICLNRHRTELSFHTYLTGEPLICEACSSKFKLEDARRCSHCRKKLQPEEVDCTDCHFMSSRFAPVDHIHCLYDYDDWTKELIFKYKFKKDIVLAEVFAALLKPHIKAMNCDMVIPLPSSPEKIVERGFDHMAEVVHRTGVSFQQPLKTKHRVKQAGLTKAERLQDSNPFYIEGGTAPRVLLIDDIYTTGLTVHRAAQVLRQEQVTEIGVLIFARV
ncbi:ComF family protein [Macrococcus equipercicus]|uniref:ComF family protein n=1 Tax=Macrococcus equipercicus TaxID=69967 RepID=A0A9Q9F1R0_9STAP|nr:ComF family protein [Macrococcus equipercicus]UTH14338.1 ComF family protein [Macrococcus equipercicus]